MEIPATPVVKTVAKTKITWGPVEAILGTIALFFVSQIVGVILLIIIVVAAGYQVQDLTQLLDRPAYLFLANLLAAGSLLAMTLGFIRLRKGNLKMIGLKAIRAVDIGYALAGYAVYFAGFVLVNILIKWQAPHWLEQNQDLGFSQNTEGPMLLLIFISLVVVPPIVEEILFRGFLFSGLRKKMNLVWAALVTSALFAAAHLAGGETSALLWVAAVDTFILSVVMCYLRERSGSLWPPICLHAIKNAIAFTVLFIFKVA